MKAKSAKGFFLLEIMIGIVVVMIATSVGYQYYDNYLTEQLNQVTAQQHKQVIKAAQTYIKSNYNTIAAQSMPYTISMATLQSSGLLPSSMSKNPYGQSYSVVVRNPGSGLMALVVTSGGQVIEEGSLPRIARLVGAEGGYVSSTNSAIANGAFKAWNETLSNYGVAPGAGHLAGSIFFDNASIASDFLYRSAVSGMPALNTMNTDINMGGHNVNNAGSLNGASANITGTVSANAVSANTVTTTTLSANSVNTNTSTVNGNQSVAGTQSVGALQNSGTTILNGPTTINAATTVNGAFVGSSVKSNLDVIASRYLQLNTAVTEGTSCSSLGVGYVARDSSGAILSCQSGVWKSQGLGLGEGQTWQDVLANRVNNTTYTNTTGRTIMLAVTSCNCRWTQIDGYVDGKRIGYSYAGDYGGTSIMSIIVPPSSTYRVYWHNLRGQPAGADEWYELR